MKKPRIIKEAERYFDNEILNEGYSREGKEVYEIDGNKIKFVSSEVEQIPKRGQAPTGNINLYSTYILTSNGEIYLKGKSDDLKIGDINIEDDDITITDYDSKYKDFIENAIESELWEQLIKGNKKKDFLMSKENDKDFEIKIPINGEVDVEYDGEYITDSPEDVYLEFVDDSFGIFQLDFVLYDETKNISFVNDDGVEQFKDYISDLMVDTHDPYDD